MSRVHTSQVIGFASFIALLTMGTTQAEAHARLVAAEPAANSSRTAPKVITLHFDDELIGKVSSFKLTDVDGAAIAVTPATAKDEKTLAATPAAALTPGLYTVTWTAASQEDGHKMTGSFSFTVK